MTKFLFTTLPTNDLGLLTRSLPIASELAQHGHKIVFCSPAKAPSKLIAEAGFENLVPKHPIYDLIAEGRDLKGLLDYIASGQWKQRYGSLFRFMSMLVSALPIKKAPGSSETWNMGHAGAQMGMLNEGLVRASCDALVELMLNYDPDIVVDFWNPFAVIAARAINKTVITVIQSDAHPDSQGLIWWKTPPAKIPTPVPVINKVMAKYGLPAIGKVEELCVGDLTLVVGTPETDPLPDSTEVTYIGPLLWQKLEARLPDWIIELDKDKPLIWIYSGNPRYSSGDDVLDSIVVIQSCIAALADEDVQVILTTGYHALPIDVLPLPTNFRHETYLPGLAMAEKSDLLIHHGGYGSCQTGLYSGKPAVIIPTYSERESNARRVAAVGAGAIVPVTYISGKKYVGTEELRTTVWHVLTNPSFAQNARRMSEKLRAYGGASQAVSIIEEFRRTGW
jgi:UDP:flavonoid glycosyltransferase YjiC (YdhE family)